MIHVEPQFDMDPRSVGETLPVGEKRSVRGSVQQCCCVLLQLSLVCVVLSHEVKTDLRSAL